MSQSEQVPIQNGFDPRPLGNGAALIVIGTWIVLVYRQGRLPEVWDMAKSTGPGLVEFAVAVQILLWLATAEQVGPVVRRIVWVALIGIVVATGLTGKLSTAAKDYASGKGLFATIGGMFGA